MLWRTIEAIIKNWLTKGNKIKSMGNEESGTFGEKVKLIIWYF